MSAGLPKFEGEDYVFPAMGMPLVAIRDDDGDHAGDVGADDGKWVALSTDANGYLRVATASGGIAAEVTVTGAVDTELAAAAALADGAANPTVPTVGGVVLAYNGTTVDRMRGDTTYGLDVDVTRLPAAARTTDSIAAALATGVIMDGLNERTPKFAVINNNTNGDNTLVAAVASRKIRVVSLFVVSAGTTTVRFESGASGTALTGTMPLVANVGFVLPFNPAGWFETAVNTLLNMELNAAVAVHGSLTYVEVA